jgi:hypothetical protein
MVKTYKKLLGFEVLTVVVMNVTIIWDITPCNPFAYQDATRWFPARLIFHPEDERDRFLRYIGLHRTTRRQILEDVNMRKTL